MKNRAVLIFALTTFGLLSCQTSRPEGTTPPAAGPVQSETDEYTRYELLGWDSHKFRITHEVSATTPDARFYYAFIRGGVFMSDVRVHDLYTGERLDADLVPGKVARENGHPTADPDDNFLRIYLARPVPAGGETRLEIQVTYEDPKSYQFTGDRIFFGRVLGVKRICVVLPPEHDFVSVNHPAQIVTQPDGRVRASLINTTTGPLSLEIVATHSRAKQQPDSASMPLPTDAGEITPASFHESLSGLRATPPTALVDRAHQDREVVWTLGDPATSSFVVQRESTEARADAGPRGEAGYWVDVMRGSRRVSNPVATALDTGSRLDAEVLSAEDARARGIASESELTDATQVVAVAFEPLKQGATLRLRVAEDVVDPDAYVLAGDELVFAAELTVARSRVVLPKGWWPTESAIPARVIETSDGRAALEFVNTSPTALEVAVRARKGR
jgi:hypothetical protein